MISLRTRLALSLPKLTDEQVASVIKQVAAYIAEQQQAYRPEGVPLNPNQVATMRPFFPASSLESARIVVLAEERIHNPTFYGELVQMGFGAGSLPDFAEMAAITFLDTVVSHGPYNSRTLFHELVHVVQYEKLGLVEFAAKYVRGFLSGGSYEAIPLEINAYELDAGFAARPTRPLSVEAKVQSWIDGGRF